MKKISEITGEDALDLWADILEPAAAIMADEELKELWNSGKPKLFFVRHILKNHKKEASEILLRLDDTPINTVNVVTRLLSLVTQLSEAPELSAFFGSPQDQTKTAPFSGSATASTEGAED